MSLIELVIVVLIIALLLGGAGVSRFGYLSLSPALIILLVLLIVLLLR